MLCYFKASLVYFCCLCLCYVFNYNDDTREDDLTSDKIP